MPEEVTYGFWSYDLELIIEEVTRLIRCGVSLTSIRWREGILEYTDNPGYDKSQWNRWSGQLETAPIPFWSRAKHMIFWEESCQTKK